MEISRDSEKPDRFDNVFREDFRLNKNGTQPRVSYVDSRRMAPGNIQIPTIIKRKKLGSIFYTHTGLIILSINLL